MPNRPSYIYLNDQRSLLELDYHKLEKNGRQGYLIMIASLLFLGWFALTLNAQGLTYALSLHCRSKDAQYAPLYAEESINAASEDPSFANLKQNLSVHDSEFKI